MSLSPPLRRLSTASSTHSRQEELINAYEAEEERIIHLLSRKLEKLREEKFELENAFEHESEAHVNKLSRELSFLRMGAATPSSSTSIQPGYDTVLETLRTENEQLRSRLVDAERDYIRVSRLNEIYREELIEHRTRLGLSVDNLIGLSADSSSQPFHHRSTSSSYSIPSSHLPTSSRPKPIPRTSSQIHRPPDNKFTFSPSTTESNTCSSVDSVFLSPQPASYVSVNTQMTSPPSSASVNSQAPIHFTAQPLTYPSVPPPSLSSSPNVLLSEPASRRNSVARRGRRESNGRVAESGSLIRPSNPNLRAVSDEDVLLNSLA